LNVVACYRSVLAFVWGSSRGFFLLSQLPWTNGMEGSIEWRNHGELVLILLRIKYNLLVATDEKGGGEKKGVAITDSHRLNQKGKRVKYGVAWRILFWYEVSGLECTMIFILLYGVSRQQNPSRPINATDHRIEYSVLSRALLQATLQRDVYNLPGESNV
jgi:hypothetical protein